MAHQENTTQNIDYGDVITSWRIPEFDKHERTKKWYIAASIAALLLLLYSFISANFLFAVIIIIAALVIILNEGKEPDKIKIELTGEGIVVGRKFYDYDEIENFSLIYKPRQEIKNLYFEFKSALRHRLSIPLENMNPVPIREILLKYLKEDLERTDQPLSEALAKFFKL
ncbi:hypothetical protein KKC83_01325 [Patescibacteria group bacterium]|nr:hypothetical protein [Candidatus Falkowbacteria bacterium]MBU4026169.1 hypothetical protein [Patescibacteria group bacterium]MBU4073201.1 hypothetical protein [Patescibacteria group bacterium]MBU4102885.1 hypothetical protein [Patescibacteria group bacterium]